MTLISCLLVTSFVLSPIAQMPVYSDIDDGLYSEQGIESKQEIYLMIKAGAWGQATKADGFAWNYFHIEVQKEIRNKTPGMELKEYQIDFKQPVRNPVTGKSSTQGRADLVMKIGKTTYIWEVKPPSYAIQPQKRKGEEQLGNYLDRELRLKPDGEYKNGGTTTYIEYGCFYRTAPSGAKYQIEYMCQPNGLVLCH